MEEQLKRVEDDRVNQNKQVWSEEVADIQPRVPSERSTSIEQIDLGMLEARDEVKRENQMPKLKVVDA